MFHNPIVKTGRFRWFCSPKGLNDHREGQSLARHARAFASLEGYVGDEPMGGCYSPPLAPTHHTKDGH
jgi:hypothetical protein